jgi:thiol-disulfide isomerase/thioredoxin
VSTPLRALIITLALAAGAFTIARSLRGDADPSTADPLVGTAAPDFSLPLLDPHADAPPTERRTLADYAGDVLLVDFWATFCAPCRRSIPHVERLAHNYAEHGVALVSINADYPDANRETAVRTFARDQRMDGDILMDDGRTTYAWEALRIPMLFIIDRDGVIQRVYRGYTEYNRLAEGLEAVLAATQRSSPSASTGGAL